MRSISGTAAVADSLSVLIVLVIVTLIPTSSWSQPCSAGASTTPGVTQNPTSACPVSASTFHIGTQCTDASISLWAKSSATLGSVAAFAKGTTNTGGGVGCIVNGKAQASAGFYAVVFIDADNCSTVDVQVNLLGSVNEMEICSGDCLVEYGYASVGQIVASLDNKGIFNIVPAGSFPITVTVPVGPLAFAVQVQFAYADVFSSAAVSREQIAAVSAAAHLGSQPFVQVSSCSGFTVNSVALNIVDNQWLGTPLSIDLDADFVPEDGDSSGSTTDNPCTTGNSAGCDDNCPTVQNTDQTDSDEDGIGDACEAVAVPATTGLGAVVLAGLLGFAAFLAAGRRASGHAGLDLTRDSLGPTRPR